MDSKNTIINTYDEEADRWFCSRIVAQEHRIAYHYRWLTPSWSQAFGHSFGLLAEMGWWLVTVVSWIVATPGILLRAIFRRLLSRMALCFPTLDNQTTQFGGLVVLGLFLSVANTFLLGALLYLLSF